MVLGVDPWVINAHPHRGTIRVSYSYRAALPGALCVQIWVFSQFTHLDGFMVAPEGSSVPRVCH